MTKRVPIEFRHFGTSMPAGAPLKVNGKTVGRLLDQVSAGTMAQQVTARAEVDPELVDKLGDGSGYGMPTISFLITRD
jgi:hypothetical protein